MEGDIKDIVLARMEKRLKDKDEEIRALKDRINDYEDADRFKALDARVGHLESELQMTQTALSEVMKKVGAVEALIVAANCEDGECEDLSDPDLQMDGRSEPMAPDIFEPGVAASLPDEGEKPEKKDAMRFFHMNKNA
jgi:hypothetical protein